MPGVYMLTTLGTEEAFAELRDFALGQAGADDERMAAAQQLNQAGRLPADHPVRLWIKGEWREILLKQFEITEEADADYSEEVIQLLVQAGEAYQDGETDAAEQIYQHILDLDPRCSPAYNNLALIAESRGDRKNMRAHLEKSLEMNPHYVMGRCNLAHLYAVEGQADRAEELIRPLFEQTRFAPFEMKAFQLVQAYIQIAHNDLEAAANILDILTELYPDDPQVEGLNEHIERLQPVAGLLARFRENNQKKHQRDDSHPLDPDTSMESCLDRHSKDPLKATARHLGLSGVSTLRKGELIGVIADGLRDPHILRRNLTQLPSSALGALDWLLERDGTVRWEEFSEHFGNDREESPYWQYGEPKTAMGILRMAGLLFVGVRQGEKWAQIPAELRSPLRELRRKSSGREE